MRLYIRFKIKGHKYLLSVEQTRSRVYIGYINMCRLILTCIYKHIKHTLPRTKTKHEDASTKLANITKSSRVEKTTMVSACSRVRGNNIRDVTNRSSSSTPTRSTTSPRPALHKLAYHRFVRRQALFTSTSDSADVPMTGDVERQASSGHPLIPMTFRRPRRTTSPLYSMLPTHCHYTNNRDFTTHAHSRYRSYSAEALRRIGR